MNRTWRERKAIAASGDKGRGCGAKLTRNEEARDAAHNEDEGDGEAHAVLLGEGADEHADEDGAGHAGHVAVRDVVGLQAHGRGEVGRLAREGSVGALVPLTDPVGPHAAAPRGLRIWSAQLASGVRCKRDRVEDALFEEGGVLPAVQADGVVRGEARGLLERRHQARNGEPHQEAAEERKPRTVLIQTKRTISDAYMRISQAKKTHKCAHVWSVTGEQLYRLQLVSQIVGFVPVGIRPEPGEGTIVDEIGYSHDAKLLKSFLVFVLWREI